VLWLATCSEGQECLCYEGEHQPGIEECGFSGEIGLLSVDIDGNDYWSGKQLNLSTGHHDL